MVATQRKSYLEFPLDKSNCYCCTRCEMLWREREEQMERYTSARIHTHKQRGRESQREAMGKFRLIFLQKRKKSIHTYISTRFAIYSKTIYLCFLFIANLFRYAYMLNSICICTCEDDIYI